MKTPTNEQLCILAQAGDRQAVSRLIEANLPFIRQTANRIIGNSTRKSFLSSCGIGMDDLIQAGSIGLWKAVAGYDLSIGNKFLPERLGNSYWKSGFLFKNAFVVSNKYAEDLALTIRFRLQYPVCRRKL